MNLRHQEILNLTRQQGKVGVTELALHFDVTEQTIRRDLNALTEAGQLARVHGGAIIPSGVINLRYEDRQALAQAEKEAMAEACARLIPEGASLFMNIGTTTETVARALLSHRDLMVITNNLNVANILAENAGIEVVVAGGILRRSDAALVGEVTAEFVQRFKLDYAVVGAAAVDLDGSLLDYDYREVRVTQAIIQNARSSILVADTGKFRRAAPVRIASLAELDVFVTDRAPPKTIRKLCKTAGVSLVVTS